MKKIFLILWRVLITFLVMAAATALVLGAYWMGEIHGALDPVRKVAYPMCVSRDVNIRESPTGYVLGHIPAGSMVWFTRLDLPFAYVAYYDGSGWLEGSITSSVLEVCSGL